MDQMLLPQRAASITETSSGDIGTWLESVLTGHAPSVDPSWRIRLAQCPFCTLLDHLERQPARNTAAEIALYQGWIDTNPNDPTLFAAWFNFGTTLASAGHRANAITAFRNALAIKPDLHIAAVNLGLQHEALGDAAAALQIWQQALQPDAARADLLTQRGRLLEATGQLAEAEATLREVLMLDPHRPDVLHHWVHLRQKICAWPVDAPPTPALSRDDVRRGCGPLGMLALTDSIAAQAACAAAWVARKTIPASFHLAPLTGYAHETIRIGYLSSDFCRHAMSFLIAELFERHDRIRVEVYGYCASRDDGSAIRARVLRAFDHVRIVRELTDEQAAATIRRDEIDILVDLNGLTEGTRLPILRWRPAPLQGTYLGFIGPLPMPELDFLLCDDFTIPPDLAPQYSPTPLPIPRVYQANDSKRAIGRPMTRAEAALPDQAFVFACFSRHYKITPDTFADWMDILRATGDAVLWLAQDNPWSEANLRAAASEAGIEAERLIFAGRVDPDLYMSRLPLADLFLDTFPYNSGTVASDALRMGLPLLTLSGEAFASRMAGSLLRAIGATDGIVTTRADYVVRAIAWATRPAEHAAFRALFTRERWDATIGDIARFTGALEDTLCARMRNVD